MEITQRIPLDPSLRAARMMEAGRVTVTFTSPSGRHITLAAKAKAQVDGRWQIVPLAEAMVVFLEVPRGGAGFPDRVGKITGARGFVPAVDADPARVWCVSQLLRFLAGQPLANGLAGLEENRCGNCGRELTDPVSIERGIGPECYGKLTGSRHQTKQAAQQALPVKAKESLAEAHAEAAAYVGEHSLQEHLDGVEGNYYIHVGLAVVARRTNSREAIEVARKHYNGRNQVTVMDNTTGQMVYQFDA